MAASRTIYNFVSFDSIDGSELSFDRLAHGTTPNGVTWVLAEGGREAV